MAKVKMGGIHSRKDRPGMYEATYYVNGRRRRVLAESKEAVTSQVTESIKEAEKEPDIPLCLTLLLRPILPVFISVVAPEIL